MAEWIRAGEVDAEDLPRLVELGSFSSDQVEAIKMALGLGWSLIFTSRESMTLVPFGEKPGVKGKRIHISAKKPVPLHRMMKQIRRGGDPDLTKRLDDIARRMHESPDPMERAKAAVEWEEAATIDVDQSAVVELMLPEFEEPKEKHVPTPSTIPTPRQVAERVEKERHIVSERPAMMHRNITKQGGQSYPSKTTVERRWSDGTIEYVCAIPDCDSEPSSNRLAFRGPHYAMHVRKGEAPPLDGEEQKNVVLDPDYTEPAFTKKTGSRRLDGLVNLLKGINLKEMSPEDLAETIEEWLKTLYGNAGGGQSEPLTAEQIIDRIRTLVDTGKYAEQEQALREQAQQMEDLMSYAEQREAELESKVLEANQRAIKAESHLDALRDLINEGISR